MTKKLIFLALIIIIGVITYFLSAREKQNIEITKSPVTTEWQLPPNDNIIFIVFDTLRADHLPFYGYQLNTAPFLTKVAEKSVVFENAFSASSHTAPAMASVFTALYPSQHGIINGKHATTRMKNSDPTINLNRIPESLTTFPELLKNNGYQTFGAADNLNICEEMGFVQGFDKFVTTTYAGAPTLNDNILKYEPELKNKYLMYLHYMDPHIPYHQRDPWFQEFGGAGDLAAYDSEIRYADEHLKKLFDKFNWLENSLVIFIADHGEEFGDHGGTGHSKTLYPEVIKVPFLVYHRDLKAQRVKDTVHTLDILPTLAKILAVPTEPIWQGRSLLKLLQASETEPAPAVFAELLKHDENLRQAKRAAIQDSWLFIDTYADDRKPAKKELFDLLPDPLAKNNLISESPAMKDLMEDLLGKFLAKELGVKKENFDLPIDAETSEKLKTLGYL